MRKTTDPGANTPKEESSPRSENMWPALLPYKTLVKSMFFFPSDSILPFVLFLSSLEPLCQRYCPFLTVHTYLNISHCLVHVWKQPQMSFLRSHSPSWLIRLGWLAREPPRTSVCASPALGLQGQTITLGFVFNMGCEVQTQILKAPAHLLLLPEFIIQS